MSGVLNLFIKISSSKQIKKKSYFEFSWALKKPINHATMYDAVSLFMDCPYNILGLLGLNLLDFSFCVKF